MASILLPTFEWTDSCETLAQQVEAEDELLVIVDDETTPAAESVKGREDIELIVAGDPDGCSGKSNAIAAGLEAATQDRIILTDADVRRNDQWLNRVKQGVADHGAVTGGVLFSHSGGSGRVFGWLIEPLQAIFMLVLMLSGGLWGGAAGFHRQHIDDMAALKRELRQTVTDDLLIGEHLTISPKADFGLATTIPIHASVQEFWDRWIRYTLTFRYAENASLAVVFFLGILQAVALVFIPIITIAISVIAGLLVYRAFGSFRWTMVFMPITFLVNLLFASYAVTQSTFRWGGRTYRWTEKLSVDVIEQ